MIIRANCKINIGLDIVRRRDDGYHDIETVMYPISNLYDTITIERTDSDSTTLVQSGLTIDCPTQDNLCWKAYALLQKRTGIGNANIRLDKRVPFGAGLGGGSADAAAVVKASNRLFGLNLSDEYMERLCAEVGSDTPFFVRNRPQLSSGRGEILSPISLDLSGRWILLVKPDVYISTREAYAGVTPCLKAQPLAERIGRGIGHWQQCVSNDFEPHIFALHPVLRTVKRQLLEQGALYASMSGSGSSLYGVFDSKPDTEPFAHHPFVHCEELQ